MAQEGSVRAMAQGRSAVGTVLELKQRLGCAEEPAEKLLDIIVFESLSTWGWCMSEQEIAKQKKDVILEIIKTLKVLQDLDLSLDILVETGIGKTVNSLRKHGTAGNVAKTLVKKWKKLISPENKSGLKERKPTKKQETKSSFSKEIKPSEKSRASLLAFRSPSSTPISKKLRKEHICSEETHQTADFESPKECDYKECSSSGSKQASQDTNSQAKESEFKDSTSTESKKVSEKQHSSAANKGLSPLKEKPSKSASKQRSPKSVKKQKLVVKSKAKLSSEEEFEPPTMSFESYLNYDQVTNKRKRKAGSTGARPKKCNEQQNCSLPQKTSKRSHEEEGGEDVKKCESDQSETPSKKAKVVSLQELLNTPLPKFLTGISSSSPPCAADFTLSIAPVVEAPQQVSETVQFTGRRLNSKMQVYSGSKPVCLSKMLTLYEQCIRVLQNNIDLLQEVGGVPFEILEPVLTCCTPEQLFRIEECNLKEKTTTVFTTEIAEKVIIEPTVLKLQAVKVAKHTSQEVAGVRFQMFIKESDHLWKKHCQRDFKNESLLEYESWREMYLRLFNQREEKLKVLTRNILSAQSQKPKGRQVKMAYMTSVAKPPRNIRRQQEIHGTGGPVTQHHPIEKYNARIPENGDRNNTSSNLIPAANIGSSSSGIMIQDGKKPIKKIAPIMKKTLKALKNRAGRR